MPRLTEPDIIARVMRKLKQLGCPNVRPAERSPEWEAAKGSYTKTPDLIAGPLVGNGAAEDFFIDAFAPKGDQYAKPLAGAPTAAALIKKAIAEHGTFSVRDLGREYEPFYGPMNKKLEKYSGSRNGSPMLGLVMYFCISGNAYAGPIFALMHALAAVDDAFGLTQVPEPEKTVATMNTMFGPGHSIAIVVHRFPVQLSFLMVYADKIMDGANHEKALLLINSGVVHEDFGWSQHPVVRWLRNVAYAPIPGVS
ncbi:hypothetical protein [Sorangium sp. So ce233]|uniref:hypothetical protein n=1 Tax=Sorangium sp. So ce233 TaxID=3133290 RepID=UPI003F5E7D47